MAVVPLALRRTPLEVLATLAREPGAFLLDVPDETGRVTLLGCAPVAELSISASSGGDVLATMQRFIAETPLVDYALPFPLAGGVVACLGYELGELIEPPRDGITTAGDGPLAVLRRYDPLLAYDHARRQYTLLCAASGARRAPWLERLAAPAPSWDGPVGGPLAALMSAARYREAVGRILAYLAAGDVYQVNLTQPFTAPLFAPAWVLAAHLARRHRVPYGAYIDFGTAQLVANSPELFLRRRGRCVETQPIKGTRPRGDRPGRDAALVAELLADPKERAEHVMIVDLERNDLGRVCETGSVVVERCAARSATRRTAASSCARLAERPARRRRPGARLGVRPRAPARRRRVRHVANVHRPAVCRPGARPASGRGGARARAARPRRGGPVGAPHARARRAHAPARRRAAPDPHARRDRRWARPRAPRAADAAPRRPAAAAGPRAAAEPRRVGDPAALPA